MARIYTMVAAAVLAAFLLATCVSAPGADAPKSRGAQGNGGFVPLFNGKDLNGFYTYLQRSGKNNDPNHVFKVENGMLHIMDLPESAETQETGYLATEKEYGDFDLRFEYKWGTKRWAPRAAVARDSGCHYLFTGPDKVWENAIECQVMEGETGDLYNLNSAYALTTTVKSVTDREKAYMPKEAGGVAWAMSGSVVRRSATMDKLTEWNQVEIIVRGNTSTHIVNGRVVNHAEGIATKAGVPITQGKIAFQSEAAEMWYRGIEIRDVTK